jgi:S1-C subfamily serine protease
VTNSHVVNGAARAEVFDSEGQLLGATQYAESLSTSVDLAVLPRMGSIPGSIPLSVYVPAVGERVVVIGAPEGLTNTVSDGIVSAFRNSEGRRWMQITAPISSGSSGGPVLNSRGEVVGVSVAMLRQGQNLNFAIPASNVRAMLTSPPGRVPFPSAPTSEPRATASNRSGEGLESEVLSKVVDRG